MTVVKRSSAEDGSYVYVVLHNGMDKLFDEINKFCKGEYGRKCEVYRAFIAKKDPSNYPETMQELEGVGAELLEKVRHHLEEAHDFIRFHFAGEEEEFSMDIIPGSATDYLDSHIDETDQDSVAESDTVVLVEQGNDSAEAFLEAL